MLKKMRQFLVFLVFFVEIVRAFRVTHHANFRVDSKLSALRMPGMVADELRSAISSDGFVSAKAIVTTSMIRDITQGQKCLPLAAAALGRAITCSLLLADGMKQEETFQVSIRSCS